MKRYGVINQSETSFKYDFIKEIIAIKGFHLYENLITKNLCLGLIKKSIELNENRPPISEASFLDD